MLSHAQSCLVKYSDMHTLYTHKHRSSLQKCWPVKSTCPTETCTCSAHQCSDATQHSAFTHIENAQQHILRRCFIFKARCSQKGLQPSCIVMAVTESCEYIQVCMLGHTKKVAPQFRMSYLTTDSCCPTQSVVGLAHHHESWCVTMNEDCCSYGVGEAMS